VTPVQTEAERVVAGLEAVGPRERHPGEQVIPGVERVAAQARHATCQVLADKHAVAGAAAHFAVVSPQIELLLRQRCAPCQVVAYQPAVAGAQRALAVEAAYRPAATDGKLLLRGKPRGAHLALVLDVVAERLVVNLKRDI